MSDPGSIEGMIAAAEEQLGPIDLLVNNAASVGPIGPTWESDPVEWWRCFEVNVRAPFVCCHAVLRGMIPRRKGRIINLASGAGTRALPHMNPYALTKTTVMRFSEALAAETAPYGISVFALDPGLVQTALVESALDQSAADQWIPWFRELFETDRVVPPDTAAGLIVRLASGEADALSGRYLSVYHDLDHLIAESEVVKTDGLYVLRVAGLPEVGST
jgi:NAD(P)-dependent dehydrogenase (short-subunit alcohol dehydrogenase family)